MSPESPVLLTISVISTALSIKKPSDISDIAESPGITRVTRPSDTIPHTACGEPVPYRAYYKRCDSLEKFGVLNMGKPVRTRLTVLYTSTPAPPAAQPFPPYILTASASTSHILRSIGASPSHSSAVHPLPKKLQKALSSPPG